jgi:teichuronic acid exporter
MKSESPPPEENREASGDADSSGRQSGAALDRSLASGIAWSGGMATVTQTIRWGAALLVVRLLEPADYGIVGMAMAYRGLVQMLSEFGMGTAIVQRQNLRSIQIARIGGVSVLASVFLAGVSILGAGAVAGFFDEPRVRPIVTVLSATFVFSGIDLVAMSLMKRDLQFKNLAWISAAKSITYASVSLSLAAGGFGYWSLVYAALAGQFVRMVVAVGWKRHPIAWPHELASIRSELWFGGHIVVSQFALYIRRFADIIIVGRLLGTDALGAYNVAWNQANLAVERVTPIVTRVSPSVLAAAQDDLPALQRYVRIFTEGIALIAFPTSVGLAIVADDFVLLLFGEKWIETIGPLRVLAVAGATRSITPILSQVLIAKGLAKKNMQFTVAGAIVIPLFLLVGSRWGLVGVACGWLIGHPLVMGPILLRHALIASGMKLRAYLSALRPALIATIAMVGVVALTRASMPGEWSLGLRFACEVGVGVLVYGIGVIPAYKSRFQNFISLLRAGRRGKG